MEVCFILFNYIISGIKKIICGFLLILLDIKNECIMVSFYFSDFIIFIFRIF